MELIRMLARSANYRLDPDKRQELAQLCITDACRAEIARSR
jgi:hypothetical protein